jgi:hypothetical protein
MAIFDTRISTIVLTAAFLGYVFMYKPAIFFDGSELKSFGLKNKRKETPFPLMVGLICFIVVTYLFCKIVDTIF